MELESLKNDIYNSNCDQNSEWRSSCQCEGGSSVAISRDGLSPAIHNGGEAKAPTTDCCSGLKQALKNNKKLKELLKGVLEENHHCQLWVKASRVENQKAIRGGRSSQNGKNHMKRSQLRAVHLMWERDC
ncbi:hypothetical protein Fmac_015896 [Flemingia macrophylla]|uniref:Uncharacterized protein n=1 Tax=Flemingia macrophylla TaxID=520843 RepID=A0ABD1MGQ1_9FABA